MCADKDEAAGPEELGDEGIGLAGRCFEVGDGPQVVAFIHLQPHRGRAYIHQQHMRLSPLLHFVQELLGFLGIVRTLALDTIHFHRFLAYVNPGGNKLRDENITLASSLQIFNAFHFP